MPKLTKIVFAFFFIGFSSFLFSQEKPKDSTPDWKLSYGIKGLEIASKSNNYLIQLQSRLQFRFATPNDQDPITFDDFEGNNNSLFKINRARLKVGGHAYQTWLKYYWEYDFVGGNLLDFRMMAEFKPWLKLKVGQWKVEFSRERRISSGEQQLVDRSIINRPFTIDRQQGIELYGQFGKDMLNFSYWAAILTGTGRGNTANDDKNLMYFGRIQWNMFGKDLGFESSDLEITPKPEAILAVSALTNRSPYTRFSTSGGGSLSGYEDPENGQYRVNQLNLESAFVYQGFSWQSEFHLKEIIDKLENNQTTTLRGYYLQAGYLAHEALDWWPKDLEIAGRFSHYIPNANITQSNLDEVSLAFNYFFKGHKNKLTMEISHFDYETVSQLHNDELRFRIQWDISF